MTAKRKNKNRIGIRLLQSPVLWGIAGFCCYLPYFLAFYPGVTTPDSIWQIRQALHLTNYQNQHPFLHTLFIELCMRIAGSENVNSGAAFYSLLQMAFLSTCYAAVIRMMDKEHAPKWFLALLWVFFFLCPMNAIYSITMWKDVMFSASVVTLMVFIWHRVRSELSWRIRDKVLFAVLSVLVCLLRSNGLIAWCIFMLVFFITRRDAFRKILIPAAAALAAVLLFNGPFQSAMGVEKADLTEALSIPLQQVTWTVIRDGEEPEKERITEDEYAELGEIMDLSEVKEMHDDWLADATKELVKQNGGGSKIKADPLKYLMLYVRIGLKNPDCYLKAYYDQTYGYYMPTLGTKATYSSEVQENDIGLARTYLLPYNLVIFMYNILNIFTRVYTYVWCAAFNFYILLASMIVLRLRAAGFKKQSGSKSTKAYRSLCTGVVYMLPLGVLITVLLSTPVANDIRYVYSLFLSWLPGIYMAFAKER